MTEMSGALVVGPGHAPAGSIRFGDVVTEVTMDGEPDPAQPLIAPGLIDLQVNGGWGHDFTTDPSTIWEVAARLPAHGVTAFLPTVVTAPYTVVEGAIAVLRDGPPDGFEGAWPIGLHVEGPWLSPSFRGAHDPDLLRDPDPAVAAEWAASGVVKLVTLAPDLPGAHRCAEVLAQAGVVVSMGHTGADFDTAASALGGPWVAVTHLFNGMSRFDHRRPGAAAAALLSRRTCGMIVDGIHCHPATVAMAHRILGGARLVLVSDAMAAVGLGPGTYRLAGRSVTVTEGAARLESGTLAGSTLTLDAAARNLSVWADVPLAEALLSASTVPAALLGLTDRGRIQPGARADLVVMEPGGEVMETVIGGVRWD